MSETALEAPGQTATPIRVVGIGGSAGGLESLEELFETLPADTGMAFVVVQHLPPDFRSLMGELLGRHSDMPVVVAGEGEEVMRDHIYLMPAGKEMILHDRRLRLIDTDPGGGLSLPIDRFFRSLAIELGAQAVAIVLSGSGSDGSRGILDIKRAGGLVMVESPDTARFDGMPKSALATGLVSDARSPRELARLLCDLPPLARTDEPAIVSDDPTLDALLGCLRDLVGVDFSLYKTTTVRRRIQRRLALLHVDDLATYVERLRRDGNELDALYQDLLIGGTEFFHDPDAFAVLERDLVPALLDQVPPAQELRVWIAGCATGEEAYSIAMIFFEQLVARERPLNLRLLATDVHVGSLDVARTAVYGERQLANVDPQRLARFFVRRATGYQISQDLRQLIIFARHDVTKDAPFTKMHLISCRNLLIYLKPLAQREVLSRLRFGLAPQGVLFLGASESPGAQSNELIAIDDRSKLYRRRRDAPPVPPQRLPLVSSPRRAPIELPRAPSAELSLLATYDQLLDRFMPPSLLIDEDRHLIDSFGGAEALLKVRRRRPSYDVLELLDDDLRVAVGGAFERALRDLAPVAYHGVRVSDEHGERRCTLSAEPFRNPRTGARHVLIRFDSDARTNQELAASNEALQSINEELHALNEELSTVNTELQQKIAELEELNSDMQHLLEGTDVGTMFLDRELRIRRFTARIASIFHIQPGDVGRRISDFSNNVERPMLIEDIERVRRDGVVIEDEVRDRAGTPYFLRILPYRPPMLARLDGVVLTLTDLSAIDRAQARLAQLSAIVESCDDAIVGQTLDGTITTWNRSAERLYGYTANEAIGRDVRMLMARDAQGEPDELLDRVRRGDKVEHVRSLQLRKDGSPIEVSVTTSPIHDRDGGVTGASAITRDITPLVAAEREVEDRQERIQLLLASTAEAIFGLDREGRCTFCNPAFLRMLGIESAAELIGESIHARIHPRGDDGTAHGEHDCNIYRACHDGVSSHADDDVLWRADDTPVPVEYWSYPIRQGDEVVGAVVTCLDITERRHAQDELRIAARRREQFLAMLSHELRNPLAAMLSAIRVMRETEFEPQTMARGQAVVERQAQHMARLLDDLLDVSRITRGKFELRKDDGDLRAAVEAAIETTAPLLASRRIQLTADLTGGVVPVHGDQTRLQQVVVNLLSNAAIYSPAGSGIELRLERDGAQGVLRVRDHGIGIEGDLLGAIFELFVQADQPLDRAPGGLGVGLSLARTIVELHGGTITAASEGPGHGSEFTVRIPLHRRARAAPGVAAAPRATGRRVVLVEDQADSREMLRMLLEKHGHRVTDVGDGAEAIEVIERERPEVALIDIGLPGMSGYEVAQALRRRPELDHVVLVALTGYGAPSDLARAREAGFDEHVIKPARLDTIEAILARGRSSPPTS